MDANRIDRGAVIGAGTMGHGIAQVLAMCGVTTRLFDVDEAAVELGLSKIRANLDKGVSKGKVEPAARDSALARLSGCTRLVEAADEAQVAIEAVPERMDLKQSIFKELEQSMADDAILATNTSSLPVSEIAAPLRVPERLVGMHFFNPVHIMKLVEVVRGERSSDAAVETTMALARRMGKEPIDVRDSPGFASSRLGIAIGMEAIRMVETGVASAEDIDKAMVLGYGFPMGPLRLTDLVGLDVRLSIAEYLAESLGERFQPPKLLREMVERGELGKKSGRGFYGWE